jgi:tRNA pseudouridine55 synthase
MNGLIVINKPRAITSMDVIRIIRRRTNIRKVGHAGTLDPLATGVLLVCLGTATKKIEQLMNQEKEYEAEIDLSAFTETDDAEAEPIAQEITSIPAPEDINNILTSFIGAIQQIPPKYSALRINGVRAYQKAVRGDQFEMKPRTIHIRGVQIISYEWPLLTIRVQCGKGTYIRSLARDIGIKLNTGGYLTKLTRTAVGNFTLQQAVDPHDVLPEHLIEL